MNQIVQNNRGRHVLSITRITISICLLLLAGNKTKAGDYYWVGGTGNWSDYANHWATTSGGLIFHIQIPGPFDDVYFDANSFTATGQTVIVDSTIIFFNDMDWNGVLNNPSISGSYINLKIYGSLILSNAMDWNLFWCDLDFEATSAGKTITTAGQNLHGSDVNFNGIGGEWTLTGTLAAGAGSIYLNEGTFNTNNQAVGCSVFGSNGTANLNLGISVITCGQWSTSISGTALDADSSIINCGGYFTGGNSNVYNDISCDNCGFGSNNTVHDLVSTYNLSGTTNNTFHTVLFPGSGIISGNNTVHKATFLNGDASINGNNTFDTLYFNNPGNSVILTSGSTQIINDALLADGNCSALINFHSSSPGSYATINKSSGNITVNYLLLQDIHVTGGANFVANNSVSLGNNTGWTINSPAPQNLYWVGGTGNWEDINHWSTSSGGTGGNCIPTPFDNVFFDANSFTATGQTVTVNISPVSFNDMDWNGVLNNPSISGSYINLKIYGSLILSNAMDWNLFWCDLDFEATSAGKTITTAGQNLHGSDVNFNGIGGEWTLTGTLAAGAGSIYLNEGTFNTNNQAVGCSVFGSNGTANLNLGISVITCGQWSTSISGTALDADSSIINCGGYFTGGNSNVYNDISCDNCGFGSNNTVHDLVSTYNLSGTTNNTFHTVLFPGSGIISGNNTVHKATFLNGDASINGNNTFDTLYFNNPGNSVILTSGSTQIINDALLANPLPGFPILMHSSSGGTQATISKSSGNVCFNYFIIQDINATGGAQFYAGDYSVNLGNNTGWSFTSCAPAISNVWPGDANYDLTADNIDILYIGVAYNDTGYVRSGANLTWTAQPALDWLSQFLTGQNAKHADCDGNGIVDANDTLAVSLNYGLIHPPRLASPDLVLSGADLYFEMPTGNLVPGSNVSVPIRLGTPANPANNVYGIAFTINYDASLIQAGSMYLDYSTSWIATPANFIHLEKDFSAFGNFDMGLCRINHTNVSGNGIIATLHFTVAATASGWLTLSFSDVLAISENELPVPVNPLPSVVYTNVEEHASSESFSLYPNPVTDYLYFSTHNNSFERIEIFDRVGRKVIEANSNAKKIYLGNIASGLYLLSATDNENKKTVKLKFIKQ